MCHTHEILAERGKVLRVAHHLVEQSLKGLIFDYLCLIARECRVGRHVHEVQCLALVGQGLMESLELIERLPCLKKAIVRAHLQNVDFNDVLLHAKLNREM